MRALENIQSVFKNKNYFFLLIISFIIFILLLSFLFELYKLPLHDFELLQKIIIPEIFIPNLLFIIIASFLNALILTITIFRLKNISLNKSNATASATGIGIASILAACPFCAISLTTLLGASIVASYIAPFYNEIRIASIVFSFLVLYYVSRNLHQECDECRIKI